MMTKAKFKPNKGVKKRVRITRTGKVKRRRAGLGHLCSHKPGHKRRRLRRPVLCPAAEEKRLRAMLVGS